MTGERLPLTAAIAARRASDAAAVSRRLRAERARHLAERPAATGRQEVETPWLELIVAGTRFALPLDVLAAVAPLGRPSPVLSTAPGLIGAISHRGAIVAVLDLAPLLGLGARPAPSMGMVLVPRAVPGIGLLADAVGSVRTWSMAALDAATAGAAAVLRPPLSGRSPDGILLVAVDRLLAGALPTDAPATLPVPTLPAPTLPVTDPSSADVIPGA